jgi:uncharacterized protein (DUF952 family)
MRGCAFGILHHSFTSVISKLVWEHMTRGRTQRLARVLYVACELQAVVMGGVLDWGSDCSFYSGQMQPVRWQPQTPSHLTPPLVGPLTLPLLKVVTHC